MYWEADDKQISKCCPLINAKHQEGSKLVGAWSGDVCISDKSGQGKVLGGRGVHLR